MGQGRDMQSIRLMIFYAQFHMTPPTEYHHLDIGFGVDHFSILLQKSSLKIELWGLPPDTSEFKKVTGPGG